MLIVSIKLLAKTTASCLALTIATCAFGDQNWFAPPPDPAAMSPIKLPVEVPVEELPRQDASAPQIPVQAIPQQPTVNESAPQQNPEQQNPAQVIPAQITPAQFLVAQEVPSNPYQIATIEVINQQHADGVQFPETPTPAATPSSNNDDIIQQCTALTDPSSFRNGPPSLLPEFSVAVATPARLPAIPISQPVPPLDPTNPPGSQPAINFNQPATSSCQQSNSCGSSQCDNCCNNCCDDCCCQRNWWVNVDYLALWIQANHLPPLVTTSPPGTPRSQAGVLPGATVLFGNDYVDGGARNGGRVTLGYWLDDDHLNGIEASWFTVGQPTGAANFFRDSSGLPILARPFTSGGIPNAQLSAFPGVVMGQPHTPGTVGVTSTSSMDFADIVFSHVFDRDGWQQTSWVAGYRHLEFREKMRIFENFLTLPTPSTAFNLVDQFQTNNDFEGGQLGLQFMRMSGPWTLNGLANLGFGNVHEYVNIEGNTTVTDPVGNITHQPGLLAQPSNDGVHSRNVFAFLPELEMNLHYQLTDQIDLSVGYTFLFLTRVARVGDQIDTNVGSTQLPTANPTAGGSGPTEVLRDTSLWAQGISGGISLRF